MVVSRDVVSFAPAILAVSTTRRAVLLAVAIATAATMLPAVARASFAGQNGILAYSASLPLDPSETAIWAIDPITGNQLQLTSGPDDQAPAFAPSGNVLAFERLTGEVSTIFLAHADGSDTRALTTGTEPSFSPDGSQIVFVRPNGLFVSRLAPGSTVQQITHDAGDGAPEWGPHGVIVFERVRLLHRDIEGSARPLFENILETITPPASRVTPLMTFQQRPGSRPSEFSTELHPDFSPNGRTIAVTLCNAQSTEKAPTTPALLLRGECSEAVWAPDGHGLIEPQAGFLTGRPETTCPGRLGPTQIAWQPLRAGTLHVATAPCEAYSTPASPAVEPSIEVRGSETCFIIRHRRRCHIVK